jgi:UDP-N-acetylmuramoyl-tripeptide--D-alanyl-D-alanine ligase
VVRREEVNLPLRVEVGMKLSEIVSALSARVAGKIMGEIAGVALDSRALQKGDLFFALRSTRDGHEFVNQAFQSGAAAAVVDREIEAPGPCLRVADTLKALGDLANHVRKGWNGKLVAISGSSGKTTTKEMIAAILSADRPTLKGPGNWNNLLGVPLTLFLLRPSHRAAVVEMGMNAYGELAELGRIAEHDIAVLTNIGPAHLEKFGSLEGVAKAKGELFQGLRPGGVAVVNLDDRQIRKLAEPLPQKKITVSLGETGDVTAKVHKDLGAAGYLLRIRYGSETIEVETPLVGMHNVSNLLCAMGCALAAEVPADRIQAGVRRIEKVEMRLEILSPGRNVRVVNDCYNANPASMLVALETTKNLGGIRQIAVIGDMRELGEFSPRAHRDIGIKVASLKYAHLFAMGQFAGDLRQGAIQGGMPNSRITVGRTHEEIFEALAKTVAEGDTILVKGSRAMRMEEITARLVQLLGGTERK